MAATRAALSLWRRLLGLLGSVLGGLLAAGSARAVDLPEDKEKAAEVAAKLGVTFPILLDTEKTVSKLYDVSTMPSTMIIDRDGKVRYVHRGYLAGYELDYEKQIRELLK